jgi:hypothetical protein
LSLRRNYLRTIALLLAASTSSLFAATITGTVTNGTTKKPSVGDEVILIKLAAGMEEAGHTTTDAQGKFSFTLDDNNTPHLIRAIHQGVTYHQPAPPGTKSVDVQVYDAAKKVAGVNAIADLMYLQAAGGQLGITRIFAVNNTSSPPRTQMNDANFEFYIPEGAEIEEAHAQTEGGKSVKIDPTPQAEKGRYAFVFPLRPGKTEFQVAYHMPYAGKATVDPRLIYPLQHFVAMMPRSIAFAPAQAGVYQDKQPPDLPDAIAEVASNPLPGQKLVFDISGEGTLRDQNENASNSSEGTATASVDNRPGGGLGRPIDAPDPLAKYRWPILGGFGVVLLAGVFYTMNRSKADPLVRSSAGTADGFSGVPSVQDGRGRPSPHEQPHSKLLLDALKEELFQLELEHKQGQISDPEYAKAKAALDETLARAIKRNR